MLLLPQTQRKTQYNKKMLHKNTQQYKKDSLRYSYLLHFNTLLTDFLVACFLSIESFCSLDRISSLPLDWLKDIVGTAIRLDDLN